MRAPERESFDRDAANSDCGRQSLRLSRPIRWGQRLVGLCGARGARTQVTRTCHNGILNLVTLLVRISGFRYLNTLTPCPINRHLLRAPRWP
jgi:hypothetical protein